MLLLENTTKSRRNHVCTLSEEITFLQSNIIMTFFIQLLVLVSLLNQLMLFELMDPFSDQTLNFSITLFVSILKLTHLI